MGQYRIYSRPSHSPWRDVLPALPVLEGTSGDTTVDAFETDKGSETEAWHHQRHQASSNSERLQDAMTHGEGSPRVSIHI